MRIAGIAALVLLGALPAGANPESARLRDRAFALAYNLDYDEATRQMTAAAAADPSDAAAERGLAVIPWLRISFQRGAVTVDDYLGGLSRQGIALRQPPADLAAAFAEHAARALDLAERQVQARPRDPDALYELGAIVGLRASYQATAEGRVLGAFRAAKRAFDLHEQVLELDPARADAGLVVGTYRYVVSALSLPARMFAYLAGFGGGKERGIAMIETAAARGREARAEARFALVLLYNREGRYIDAGRTLAELQREFPRNRILWLEAGATALRAGRADEAERQLTTGLAMLRADVRPRMFGEEALWLQKHGAALVALGRLDDAHGALTRVLTLEARTWVRGRAHTELGKIADARGDRPTARREFSSAVTLAEQDNDPIGAATARPWVETRFTADGRR